MERKIIKQGGGGFTIYVPKKWVEENDLDKGDNLGVEISGKDLIISPKQGQKKLSTEITLTKMTESSIRTLVTNAYRTGYDSIKVFFQEEKQFQILQEIIKTKLIGFDIITKQDNYCVVENITEPSYDQFDNLLKKMFMNIHEIFEITQKRLEQERQTENYKEVEERILKYDNFCRRVISKQKLIKQNSEMFWSFLGFILHGQRELYHLNKIIGKIRVSKQTIELLEGCYEIFKLIEKAYYEKDIESIAKVHELEKELVYKKAYRLYGKEDGRVIYHISSSARQFYLANSPLVGLII